MLKQNETALIYRRANAKVDPRKLSPDDQTKKVASKLVENGLLTKPDAIHKSDNAFELLE
jgi:hypothetical protein